MSYTDKELQIATQIAYMKIASKDIQDYYNEYGEYPTLQWILSNSSKTEVDVISEFMKQHDAEASADSISGIRREAAQQLVDDILSGEAECASWKIISVMDENMDSGMYGCLIETSENEAIVGYRGSEMIDLETQFQLDWVQADFGLLDSIGTQQQADAVAFLEKISKLNKQYDSYVLTGHSLGGNLAAHATIMAPDNITYKIKGCYNFDGPGFSEEYIQEHIAEILQNADKINHYQWSLVGALLYQLEEYGENYVTVQLSDDIASNYQYDALVFKHDTAFLIYDDEGNVITTEMGKFEKSLRNFTRIVDGHSEGNSELANEIYEYFTTLDTNEKALWGSIAVIALENVASGIGIFATTNPHITSFIIMDYMFNDAETINTVVVPGILNSVNVIDGFFHISSDTANALLNDILILSVKTADNFNDINRATIDATINRIANICSAYEAWNNMWSEITLNNCELSVLMTGTFLNSWEKWNNYRNVLIENNVGIPIIRDAALLSAFLIDYGREIYENRDKILDFAIDNYDAWMTYLEAMAQYMYNEMQNWGEFWTDVKNATVEQIAAWNEFLGSVTDTMKESWDTWCEFWDNRWEDVYEHFDIAYNLIIGTQLSDTLSGTDVDDLIVGGAGDDTINGAAGNDEIYGEADNDTLHGDTGMDKLYGGNGNDELHGGEDDDELYGEANDDTIYGGIGLDKLFGDDGNDTLSGGADDDELFGGEGDDTLHGDDGNDYIEGGNGNNYLYGDAGDDTIVTGEDTDHAFGGAGNDYVIGGNGANYMYGEDGDDRLQGGEGYDYMEGGLGVDTLSGGNGYNEMYGQEGNDFIYGGDHADYIDGGVGDDQLYGANATDGQNEIYGREGNDTIYDGEQGAYIEGNEGDDTIRAGGGSDIIDGGTGNDYIQDDHGDDTVVFKAGYGTDTISDAAGNNTLSLSGLSIENATAYKEGNDLKLAFDTGDNLIIKQYFDGAAFQNFSVDGVLLGNLINGYNGTENDDWMSAPNTNNITLYGNGGNDTLNGGDNADTLDGGEGTDYLYGGNGDDTYIFGKGYGSDTIEDWNGSSIVKLTDINIDEVSISNSNDSALVLTVDGTGDTLTINGYKWNQGGYTFEFADGTTDTVDKDAWTWKSELGSSSDDTTGDSGTGDTTTDNPTTDDETTQPDVDTTEEYTVNGTANAEWLSAPNNNSGVINAGDGDDGLNGGSGSDRLYGGAGNDNLYGNDGDDVLDGGADADSLNGGNGTDTYIFAKGYGNDIVNEWSNDVTVIKLTDIRSDEITLNSQSENNLVISVNGTSDTLTISNYRWSQGSFTFEFADGAVATVIKETWELEYSQNPTVVMKETSAEASEDEIAQANAELLTELYTEDTLSTELISETDNTIISDVTESTTVSDEINEISDQTDLQVMVLTENMSAFSNEDNITDGTNITDVMTEDTTSQLLVNSAI